MKRIERELGECDDELDRMSPPARETGSLQSQLTNMQASVSLYHSVSLPLCMCVSVCILLLYDEVPAVLFSA